MELSGRVHIQCPQGLWFNDEQMMEEGREAVREGKERQKGVKKEKTTKFTLKQPQPGPSRGLPEEGKSVTGEDNSTYAIAPEDFPVCKNRLKAAISMILTLC